jgi:hypothetical protein
MRRVLSSFLLTLLALPAHAQENAWSFTVTPYAWLMGASGSTAAKGQTIDVNAGVVDMFGKTDTLVPLMASIEARRDKLSFGLDFIFTQMVATPAFATQRNPTPWLSFSAAAGANVKSTMVMVEGSGTYEMFRPTEKTAVDALLGVRYWHTATDVNLGFTATGTIRFPWDAGLSQSGGFAVASTGNMDWADPVVGLVLRHEIAPHHRLRLRGDIGGFGVGSQLAWQAFGGYSYEFSSGPTSWSAVSWAIGRSGSIIAPVPASTIALSIWFCTARCWASV